MDTDEFMWKLGEAWDRLESRYDMEFLNLDKEAYRFDSFREYLNSLPAGDALFLVSKEYPHG